MSDHAQHRATGGLSQARLPANRPSLSRKPATAGLETARDDDIEVDDEEAGGDGEGEDDRSVSSYQNIVLPCPTA